MSSLSDMVAMMSIEGEYVSLNVKRRGTLATARHVLIAAATSHCALIGKRHRLNSSPSRGICGDNLTLPVGEAGCRHVLPRQACVIQCLWSCVEAVSAGMNEPSRSHCELLMARHGCCSSRGMGAEGTRKLVRRDCGKSRLSVSTASFRTKSYESKSDLANHPGVITSS
jgi:hypothetical protein